LARLQGLLEVDPARFLAAMLGYLGVSTCRMIKTMTQFFFSFEHQTSHVVCFNARGLLYECVFEALLFSSSYRPVGKPFSHHVVTRPTFSFFSFLDDHTGHPARHDARILLMSASSMPSEFFHCHFDLLEVCFPQVITRPLFVRQDCKQVGCQVDLFFFLLDRRACYSTCR
jgi:hypothetical protein